MLSGTVKWFNNKKGYGFIKTPENEKDIFVHITEIQKYGLDKITEGQELSYDIVPDGNGSQEPHKQSLLQNKFM